MASRFATCASSPAASAASCSYLPSTTTTSTRGHRKLAGFVHPACAWWRPCPAATTASPAWSAEDLSTRLAPRPSKAARGRGRGGVLCEVAVELGGARSSKEESGVGVGARVKVKGALKVFHVAKIPELDLDGLEGEVKDVLGEWKGKPVSANLPYKVEFTVDRDGKALKFFAHLRDGEFEVVG